jgi:hypothetical protein
MACAINIFTNAFTSYHNDVNTELFRLLRPAGQGTRRKVPAGLLTTKKLCSSLNMKAVGVAWFRLSLLTLLNCKYVNMNCSRSVVPNVGHTPHRGAI